MEACTRCAILSLMIALSSAELKCVWEYKAKSYLSGWARSEFTDQKYSTLEEAQALCVTLGDDCGGVTYSTNAEYSVRRGKEFISNDPEDSWQKICINYQCREVGIDMLGMDIGKIETENEQECVEKCSSTTEAKCVAVTFVEEPPALRGCYRKFGIPNRVAVNDMVSISMSCVANSNVNFQRCREVGIDLLGSDIGMIETANEQECVEKCSFTENCVAVTFVRDPPESRGCYRKYEIPDLVDVTGEYPAKDMVSIRMSCVGNSNVNYQRCREVGKDMRGSDIGMIQTANEQECVEKCSSTENCVAVTFVRDPPESRGCYRKDEIPNRVDVTGAYPKTDMVSISMSCVANSTESDDSAE